jgi:hypothetical protein
MINALQHHPMIQAIRNKQESKEHTAIIEDATKTAAILATLGKSNVPFQWGQADDEQAQTTLKARCATCNKLAAN